MFSDHINIKTLTTEDKLTKKKREENIKRCVYYKTKP